MRLDGLYASAARWTDILFNSMFSVFAEHPLLISFPVSVATNKKQTSAADVGAVPPVCAAA